ncbi:MULTISPECIES: hypothetical protein, partial [unclassified Streptomyces]|uniref:hypothetical protein n=1 Tax=unclassified Streptomyces TaxID=2593676 RepID=UPI001C4020A7
PPPGRVIEAGTAAGRQACLAPPPPRAYSRFRPCAYGRLHHARTAYAAVAVLRTALPGGPVSGSVV